MKLNDFKRDLNKREFIGLGAALLILLAVFIKSFLGAEQSLRRVEEEIEAFSKQEKAYQDEKSPLASKDSGDKDETTKPKDLQKINDLILNPAQLIGLKLSKSNFLPTSVVDNNLKQEASISLQGELADLASYVNYLESLKPPFLIEQFTLTAQENSNDLSLDLTGAVYAKN